MSIRVLNELKRLGMNDEAALKLALSVKSTYPGSSDNALVLFFSRERIFQLRLGIKNSIRTYNEYSEYVQKRMADFEEQLQAIYTVTK